MGPRPPRPPRAAVRRRPDERPVFVRFVCFELVEGQRSRLGLFQAIRTARESDHASGWALAEVEDAITWFNENLEAPKHFSRKGGQSALSWFKPAAEEHIRRMHGLKAALEDCGIHVEVLTTREPGFVLYEDEHQIAAEPLHNRF
ncbi:hypothetical protein QO010_002852 [Caulobacter ginsengisoli]|uniref:VOC domain-containing protein n=1 Tax=Caulobacter ginsengisoli TaxID=400775 RepID=A0ABU0ISU3_9CAUL|nr:hypothetical protein [Caulobacter ginsengisoli]MDQ0465068.1 hypothetical protein [Caulobacter ginsengisoli]